ncbi:hypothetical protein [Psychrobacillus lasiicapitis]|uniref:Translation initiation factor 2 n=1 Tax=Psychrobacillus lasiicapitis TaxID=1636719 RepID=A0A544SYE8_9BACI|nr:hypothetical protein [Psychrobacillus lasiicapitis]TQR10179.1 hypothetical protein FG382_17590 [Psychrobacillus lasiicapitis]GGA46064.1 hypothetical protein GCM10011384_39710 [Psychrobacillus lasiicapitis]
MTNSGSINQNNQDSNKAISAAELAVLGALFTTFGDVLATIAAVLALEEERKDDGDNNDLQKQIDDLTNEVKKLKKHINNDKPRRF